MADNQKKKNSNNVEQENNNLYTTNYTMQMDSYQPYNYESYNFNDILIDNNNQIDNQEKKAEVVENNENSLEEDAKKINTEQEVKPVEQNDKKVNTDQTNNQVQNNVNNQQDDLDMNAEVNKYEKELAETRAQLKQYLSKFSDEYLDKIRKSDYYKERLAYWKDYYAKRRQEAEIKDQENNLARQQAMQQDNEEQKKQQETKKQQTYFDATYNGTTVVYDPQQVKNINNISRADMFIDEINKRIGNEQKEETVEDDKKVTTVEEDKKVVTEEEKKAVVVEEEKKVTDNQDNKHPLEEDAKKIVTDEVKPGDQNKPNAELTAKINEYVTAILLDSMHDSLVSERDDVRKAIIKLASTTKTSAPYISDKFNEKYNLYSDALASFDNVVTKGRSENKTASAKRQKEASNFTENPNLLAANDILIDNLRTTFVQKFAEYLTDRIVTQITEQNAENTIVLTKASVKDLVNQIVTAAGPQFEQLEEKIKDNSDKRVKNLQQECEDIKTKLKDKNLSKEEREKLKQQLAEKQNQVEYEKFNNKFVIAKQTKLLKKGTADFVMNQAFGSEIAKIMRLNGAKTLNEYNINPEATEKMVNQIISVLDKSKNVALNLKVSETKQVEQEQVEQKPEVVEVEVVEEPKEQVVSNPVKTPLVTYIARDEFAETRSDVLELLATLSDMYEEKNRKNGNEDMAEYFRVKGNELREEHAHWFGQVLGVKIRIDEIEKQEKSPDEKELEGLKTLYNEMYISDDLSISQTKVNKQAAYKKFIELVGDASSYEEIKQVYETYSKQPHAATGLEVKAHLYNLMATLEGEDQKIQQRYIRDYKRYLLITSDESYLASVKNKTIKLAIQALDDNKRIIMGYNDCLARDNEWRELIDAQIKQESKYALSPEECPVEYLQQALKDLDKNQMFYNQEIVDELEGLKICLDMFDTNKAKLDKLEQAILDSQKAKEEEKLNKQVLNG